MFADLGPNMAEGITREIRQEPPQGAITKPYSRAAWDKYWNDRIFQLWKMGTGDCDGTYKGPSGQDLIRKAIARRREIGLPEINLEDRNRDKGL